jgi:hypothetical protein
VTTWVLLAAAALLGLLASKMWAMMRRAEGPWKRPLGIMMGGVIGVAVSIPLAAVLNPLVGLNPGHFHNLLIITICLAFLGFVVGSLAGLVYAGMIPSAPSRMDSEPTPFGDAKPH